MTFYALVATLLSCGGVGKEVELLVVGDNCSNWILHM